MHIAFLNIQGNFDAEDRYWTAHPDFGGQLVYVKEVTLALGRMGHRIEIARKHPTGHKSGRQFSGCTKRMPTRTKRPSSRVSSPRGARGSSGAC